MDETKRQAIIRELKELRDDPDIEVTHAEADRILCGVLQDLGYEDIVKEWRALEKWYA